MQQCKQLLPLPSLSHGVFTVSPVQETPGIPGQAADKLPSGGGTNCQVTLTLFVQLVHLRPSTTRKMMARL